jgi:formate hydrogenlyase subunit 6/NADH:ubiquinone oxidoreductase subunit I
MSSCINCGINCNDQCSTNCIGSCRRSCFRSYQESECIENNELFEEISERKNKKEHPILNEILSLVIKFALVGALRYIVPHMLKVVPDIIKVMP